jgi:hypothetical protein
LAAADLLLGAQGTGNTITLAASTVPVVNTTSSNATSSVLTTALDDVITSAASTALVGTAAAINGGLGRDTLNSTLLTADLLTSLTTGGTAGAAVTGVEVFGFTQTTGGNLNIGTNTNTDWTSFTVSATDLNAALTLTTNASGQTVTVNNTTSGGTGSAITLGSGLTSQVITTGTPNDTVNIPLATAGSTVSTNAGNDTINLTANGTVVSFAGALPTTTTMVINGGTGTDTLAFADTLAASENINLQTYVTAGILVGIEGFSVTATNIDNSAHTITLATGITSVTVDSNDAAENFTITGTAAQVNALTSVIDTTGTGTATVTISDAGTVSFSTDTTTNIDAVTYQDVAINLTLNNAAHTVTQGGTTAGTAAQTVTYGTTAAAQSVTINSTGTVQFNETTTNLTAMAAGDVGDHTVAAVSGATVTLNITGGATTTADFTDADLVLTNANLDTINVGAVTAASTFSYGAGTSTTLLAAPTNATTLAAGPVTAIASSGSTNIAFTLATDSGNASTRTLVVSGFTAGAGTGADVINLGGTIATQTGVVTTGAAFAQAAAGAATENVILSGSAFQISGSLTQTGNAGEVEAKVIAAALTLAAQTDTRVGYVTMDNGTDTGIYRVTLAGTAGTAGVIDNTADFAVTLVAVLQGVSDSGTLVAGNIV